MAREQVKLKITLAWWLPLYVKVLTLACMLTGLEPDWDKVERTVKRAVRMRLDAS